MTIGLIADDEPLMRAALADALADLWPDLHIVAEAEDGLHALRLIQEHRPDVCFLDIKMPGMTGLEVARVAAGSAGVCVFVTAFDHHAVEAFEADAIDYLLKPVDRLRLARVVQKVRARLPALPTLEWLQVQVGRAVRMAQWPDILYFKSDTKYTQVTTAEWSGLVRLSLKELAEAGRQHGFLQVHRSIVVNRRHISGVHWVDDRMELELRGSADRLPVSQPHQGLFRAM